MARKTKNIEQPPSVPDICLFLQTANAVFLACLNNAGIKEQRHWPALLSEAMAEKFGKKVAGLLTPKYLYNVFHKIKSEKRKNENGKIYLSGYLFKFVIDYSGLNHKSLDIAVENTIEQISYTLGGKKNNLPQPFREHISLVDSLQQIKEQTGHEDYPVTALYGLPGMGKSWLAIDYAWVSLSEYAGGCWYIPTVEKMGFRQRLIEFAMTDWEIAFTEQETKDKNAQWNKLKSILEKPLLSNKTRRTLLIFDNVDAPGSMFSDAEIDANFIHGIHILITTRQMAFQSRKIKWLSIDGFQEVEGVMLLKKYRPFRSADDELNATLIVTRLNGFALALSVIGVQLSLNTKAQFADVLTDMETGSVDFLDYSGQRLHDVPGHYEQRIITQLFSPVLEKLPAESLRLLEYAALLPAEQVPLAWIERLLKDELPARFLEPRYKTEFTPWQLLIQTITGLSLITGSSEMEIGRMHGLLQEVVKNQPARKYEIIDADERLLILGMRLTDEIIKNFDIAEISSDTSALLAFAKMNLNKDYYPAYFWNNISVIERYLGNYSAAKTFIEKAIAMEQGHFSEDHVNFATRYYNLGEIEKNLGNYKEAKSWVSRALKINQKHFEKDHLEFTYNYNSLSLIEIELGNYAAGRKWLEKSISILEKDPVQNQFFLGTAYANMALAEKCLGDYLSAIEWNRKSVAIYENYYGPGHPLLAPYYNNIGMTEKGMGNYQNALEWMQKAIEIDEKYHAGHPDLGIRFFNMAMIETETGNYSAAKSWMYKAFDIFKAAYDPLHPYLVDTFTQFGHIDQLLGNFEAANGYFQHVLDMYKVIHPPGHPIFGQLYLNLAMSERGLGNNREARKLLKKTFANYQKNYSADHPNMGIYYGNLAMVENDEQNYPEAKKLTQAAISINEKQFAPGHPTLGVLYRNLALINLAAGDGSPICGLLQKAYMIFKKIYGDEHYLTRCCLQELADQCPDFTLS